MSVKERKIEQGEENLDFFSFYGISGTQLQLVNFSPPEGGERASKIQSLSLTNSEH